MASAIAMLLIMFLPLYGGYYVGIRNERKSMARLYLAILEARRRPTHRRLRR